MGKILTLIVTLSSLVFAADPSHTDIIPRTVNFVLFVGILWYLLADPIKNFFTNRSASIANELKTVQDKLNESVQKKREALTKISEAEKLAVEILESAKKESKVLNDSILEQCENDIANLEKAFESKKELAERRMIASVVEEVLQEVVKEGVSELSKDAMVNVILKKVA